MNEVIEILHKTSTLTYADCYTLYTDVFIGVFMANGTYAFYVLIRNHIKRRNKNAEKTNM